MLKTFGASKPFSWTPCCKASSMTRRKAFVSLSYLDGSEPRRSRFPRKECVMLSGYHQLRLVVYPKNLQRFYISQVVVWDVFHQQQFGSWEKKLWDLLVVSIF